MNKFQRRILVLAAVCIALMLIYPPFVVHGMNGLRRPAGFGFIFTGIKGDSYAVVNPGQLMVQWVGVVLIAGICFKLAESFVDDGTDTEFERERRPEGKRGVSIWAAVRQVFRPAIFWLWLGFGGVAATLIAGQGQSGSIVKAFGIAGAATLCFLISMIWNSSRTWVGVQDKNAVKRVDWKRVGVALTIIGLLIVGVAVSKYLSNHGAGTNGAVITRPNTFGQLEPPNPTQDELGGMPVVEEKAVNPQGQRAKTQDTDQ